MKLTALKYLEQSNKSGNLLERNFWSLCGRKKKHLIYILDLFFSPFSEVIVRKVQQRKVKEKEKKRRQNFLKAKMNHTSKYFPQYTQLRNYLRYCLFDILKMNEHLNLKLKLFTEFQKLFLTNVTSVLIFLYLFGKHLEKGFTILKQYDTIWLQFHALLN